LDKKSSEIGWRIDAQHSGGGLFMDLGSHQLDIIDFILGPLGQITGDAVNIGVGEDVKVETVVSMMFRLQNGAIGTASWNFAASFREDLLTINGTRGRLKIPIFIDEPPRVESREGGVVDFKSDSYEHVHQPLVQLIVDELRQRAQGITIEKSNVPSNGVSGLRTAIVMDTVLRNFYRIRQDGFWKRSHTWQSATVQT